MELKERVRKPKGTISLWCLDPVTLRIREHRRCPNQIVEPGGTTWLAGRVIGGAGWTNLDSLKVGTGTTAATVDDKALETELASASLVRNPWQGFGSDSNKLYVMSLFDTDEAVGSIGEAAIFYGPTMFNRALVDPVVPKALGELLVVRWEIAF